MSELLSSLNSSNQQKLFNQQLAPVERIEREVALDWIRQEYETLGLRRALTAQDEMGLLKQAGFSTKHIDKSIPSASFDAFCDKFKEALKILALVSRYWNMEDPCVIAGFDCDKTRAESALQSRTPGTFIIRMSFGDFGKLVVTLVTVRGIVHYAVQVKDFAGRSLGQLVMGLKGAEVLFDVFSLRQFNKQDVFVEGDVRRS
eukprot:TRINITY_DN4577_c0_g2_i1.p2 TRINITY_DN4577_c0_g2~~TRINITY_DN4577_c0_g2_i1.p2  ORF type:complete len:202 (-),score=33.07 TRINITY_DN4577_c0_g2_i1:296-901(-)